jgi:predicted NBD/HSP70 family sugar kinase
MNEKMQDHFRLIEPALLPPLDRDFRPAVLANHAFLKDVEESGSGTPLVIGLERSDGSVSRYETRVFPDGHERADANLRYAERLVKFLLWQRGGWKIYVGGPVGIGEHIAETYSPTGSRRFDYRFMGEEIYERVFSVVCCSSSEVPPENETKRELGGHFDRCRIGFDLGASDRKISSVIDGKAVFSEEVVWEPSRHSDPQYHYTELMAAIKKAASKMPKVDAIGGSSAGVIINNRVIRASLFRDVPSERFDEARNLFLRVGEEMGVPLEVANDGDVAALAGSISLEDTGVLGIALGSSEAAGYVTVDGKITGWLNELAFAPVDYNPNAPVDEWSGDIGCGALYFSQKCVFRLAEKAGIEMPERKPDAEKLKHIQAELEAGHKAAEKIWQTIGYYMGYGIAHYADYYEVKHVLILGRCTSGKGGQIILDGAGAVLESEFPLLASKMDIHLPDEEDRRVGQSIAAASLPAIKKEER